MEAFFPSQRKVNVSRRLTKASQKRSNIEYLRNEALHAIKKAADRKGQSCSKSEEHILSSASASANASAAISAAAAVASANSYEEEAIVSSQTATQYAAAVNKELADVMAIVSAIAKCATAATKAETEAQENAYNFLYLYNCFVPLSM